MLERIPQQEDGGTRYFAVRAVGVPAARHLYTGAWMANPPVVVTFMYGDKVFTYGLWHAFEEDLPRILLQTVFELPIEAPLVALMAGEISAEVNNIVFRFSTRRYVFTSSRKRE